MSFSNIMVQFVFKPIFIIILYVILYYALKIMYKDVKNGGKKRRSPRTNGNYGLEIIKSGDAKELKEGSIIPIRSDLSIGRKDGNSIIMADQHVSGNHAQILVRNNGLFLEDLNSTNGTYLNGNKLKGRAKLSNKDEIRIGSGVFKILT